MKMQLNDTRSVKTGNYNSNAQLCSNHHWQIGAAVGCKKKDQNKGWSLRAGEKAAHGWLKSAVGSLDLLARGKNMFNTGRLAIVALALFFGVGLMACKGREGDKEVSAGVPKLTQASRVTGVAAQAPDLTVQDINGNTLQLSALKGKVVFINFWATWCPPCREEMPTIDKLKAHFEDDKDMVFLMIDIDGNLGTSSKYLKNKGYDLRVFKANGPITAQYLGQSIPTTVILDKEGVIVARVEGASDYGTQEVISGISRLLNK